MDLKNLIVEWSICDQKIKENNAITKNLRERSLNCRLCYKRNREKQYDRKCL